MQPVQTITHHIADLSTSVRAWMLQWHPLLWPHLLLRQTWDQRHHHRFPFRGFTGPVHHYRRGTTVNPETGGAFWPSANSCSICSPAPFPRKPPGWRTSSPNSPGRLGSGERLHGVQVCPASNHRILYAGDASCLRSVHDGSWCGSGDSEASPGRELCLGLLHWVPDPSHWQRLGGACPGRLLHPWSLREGEGWAPHQRTPGRPGQHHSSGFYRWFIRSYSTIAAPLTHLTSVKIRFIWDEAADKGFRELKRRFVSAPTPCSSQIPSLSSSWRVDASNVGVGGHLVPAFSWGPECAPLRILLPSLDPSRTELRHLE